MLTPQLPYALGSHIHLHLRDQGVGGGGIGSPGRNVAQVVNPKGSSEMGVHLWCDGEGIL